MDRHTYPYFKHPFTMIVSGSTGSGKTEWLMRLLANTDKLVQPAPRTVLYCYGELNDNVLELQREGRRGTVTVITHSGVPSEEQVRSLAIKQAPLVMVLDDLMLGIDEHYLSVLFTRGSHNWGVSVILVTQHLFTKEMRTARNNAHYLVLMRNPVGRLQVSNLATQLFPGKRRNAFLEAYTDATQKPFSYLVVDMHPGTDEKLRLRTHIYPGEVCIVYTQQ